MNVYFELINGNKQLTPVSINESKEKIKKNEERWINTRDLVRSVTKNLDDYDEKYDSDDNLPLNKTIEIFSCFTKITNIIHKFFLDEYLYKI